MAPKPKNLRLGEGELHIMAMLWEKGPLTLAKAHELFSNYGPAIAYPTMQTRLLRLVDKRLVARSKVRPARYKAAVSAEQVGAKHVEELADTVSRTSVAPLVAHLISERPLTSAEIDELRTLLSEAEKRNKAKAKSKRRPKS